MPGLASTTKAPCGVDKLDKIGDDGVAKLLLAAGHTQEQVDQCLALARISSADSSFVKGSGPGCGERSARRGPGPPQVGHRTANEHAPGAALADLRIARGLDYYTGTVYETMLERDPGYGSICSGGRYDALASDGKRTFPGVGISIGVSRLLGLLIAEEGLTASRESPAAVLIAVNDEDSRGGLDARGDGAARSRRTDAGGAEGGEVRQADPFAERRGIPFVWFPGADGRDQVKDLRSGDQVAADPASWAPAAEDLHPSLVVPDAQSSGTDEPSDRG